MKFGTKVVVIRGSRGIQRPNPGHLREVEGICIGKRGPNVRVRLTQDDPAATVGYCEHKGDVGWWSKSVVTPKKRGCEP